MADRSLDQPGAALDDSLWGHRWGFRDTAFRMASDGCAEVTGQRYAISGTRMPGLRPFVEEAVGLPGCLRQPLLERASKPVPPARLETALVEALAAKFPAECYTTDPTQRLLHSHGQATGDEVRRVLFGELKRVVDLVFYARSEQDVADLIELAGRLHFCLVPYGGGTSVSCALKLPESERRSLVSLDMRGLNRLEWIDRENLRASVQAGITGRQLETELARAGFTSGHEPDSIELSTLGGWIATNASGMKKNRYGNIEELVEQVTLVTPSGALAHCQVHPRVSMGIQPERLVFGSEGNLGVITRAVIRIFPLPEERRFGSIVFPDFASGLSFLREVAGARPLPASIRLVDNAQFRFSQALKPARGPLGAVKAWFEQNALGLLGYAPRRLCAATVLMEGSAGEVARQTQEIRRLAKRHRGFSGGAANGRRGYALTYAIAYIRDFLVDYAIIGETLETTVAWTNINQVMEGVRQCIQEQHAIHRLPGRPWMSARITQLYHSGVCLYLTHCYSLAGVEGSLEVPTAIEKAMRAAILQAGGSISHHHGVGKIRSQFLEQTLTASAQESVRALKQALDPQNIFGIGNNLFHRDGP